MLKELIRDMAKTFKIGFSSNELIEACSKPAADPKAKLHNFHVREAVYEMIDEGNLIEDGMGNLTLSSKTVW